MDSNPGKAFLLESCVVDPAGTVSAKRLRVSYETYCHEYGHSKPLGATQFAQEVRRVFPKAVYSRNAVKVFDTLDDTGLGQVVRSRAWEGFRLRTSKDD